jgi:hypothetical protein
VEVEDLETGDRGIGTAFHVGDGVFVTALHVVFNKRIVKLGTTFCHLIPDETGLLLIGNGSFREVNEFIVESPKVLLPKASRIENAPDVAAILVDLPDPLPALPLGSHLDDWLGIDDMVLHRGLLLGYPPVPFSKEPRLLAVTCEINSLIDRYERHHPHFIISSMARGGFSGAPVLHESNFVLGLVTESLVTNGKSEELGFMAVLTVEPIYALLYECGCLPRIQTERFAGGVWPGGEGGGPPDY